MDINILILSLLMQESYSIAIEAIRSSREPALLLATLILHSINNLLNMVKDPKMVPFFLYGSALQHLREKNFDGFWREVDFGIKDARKEINALSTHVTNWQWDNFDTWFMARTSRFDELQDFNRDVYSLYLDELECVVKKNFYGDTNRLWQNLRDLTTFSRERTSRYILDYLMNTLGNKVIIAQRSYSFIKPLSDGRSRKVYVVFLNDFIKRPDETMDDIINGTRNLSRESIAWHCKLYGLYWLLTLVTTGNTF
ncbi:hypothetical protein EROM_081960 [Encephalitozoon romaleae SJ-2008]|uniref:Uncharacterized protein n=1 Tax=Encephalitozoon romaleae (strain SJ-2008) TaxID=1178016 RepID=I7AFU3_ENCRO|nr:hypothetical protein EROM_081960 [Encephalitozoon romaleae SJ-2008]AFN83610.1 hypothetical protein EROM_081960 [Encephalitozoon romaleae SJ-2008]